MKQVIVLFFLCGLIGCSQGTLITGTVRFEDETPITGGGVVFDSSKNSFFGTIKPNGTYATGGVKEVEGIPDGTYTVWLTGTEEIVDRLNAAGQPVGYVAKPRVAPAFTSASTSPLKFEVKKGGPKTFDIVVRRP